MNDVRSLVCSASCYGYTTIFTGFSLSLSLSLLPTGLLAIETKSCSSTDNMNDCEMWEDQTLDDRFYLLRLVLVSRANWRRQVVSKLHQKCLDDRNGGRNDLEMSTVILPNSIQ